MFPNAYLFRSPNDIAGLYDTFLGGFFLWKGMGIVLQMAVLTLVPLSFAVAAIASSKKQKSALWLAHLLPGLTLIISAILLFQPWDELFVNLRHSLNWAEAGKFSFNLKEMHEGTVDFLPYFLIGVLAKTGLPVVELAFFQSLLGSFLCLWAGRSLLLAWGIEEAKYWAWPILSIFGTLLLNSGHGFTTTIFASVLLWAIYHLFYGKRNLGYFLLAILPLVRIEGVWASFLLGAFAWREGKGKVADTVSFAMSFIPTILLSLGRYLAFGTAVPLPIQYKATPGNYFYLAVGIRNFFTDLVATGTMVALVTIGLTYFLGRSKLSKPLQRAITLVPLLLLFVFPYYTSGGDWFPPAWGRYIFPLAFFATLVGSACLFVVAKEVSIPARNLVLGVTILTFAMHQIPSYGSYHRIADYVFSARRILGDTTLKKKRRMNFRIHSLSQLGNHLHQTVEPGSLLATSEIATVSFFSKLETLDLLGLTNPEVIAQPVRPHPPLVQAADEETELPHLIFKRIHPGLVEKYRPDYLYLFDFVLTEIFKDIPFGDFDDATVQKAFQRWQKNYRKLVGDLYGGFEKLQAQGYRPIIVMYANENCSLYYVSAEKFETHVAKLKSLGFATTAK